MGSLRSIKSQDTPIKPTVQVQEIRDNKPQESVRVCLYEVTCYVCGRSGRLATDPDLIGSMVKNWRCCPNQGFFKEILIKLRRFWTRVKEA